MGSDIDHTTHLPLIRLLDVAFDDFSNELAKRVEAAGFTDIRPGHGCVFGTIDPQGSRLTIRPHAAEEPKRPKRHAQTEEPKLFREPESLLDRRPVKCRKERLRQHPNHRQ